MSRPLSRQFFQPDYDPFDELDNVEYEPAGAGWSPPSRTPEHIRDALPKANEDDLLSFGILHVGSRRVPMAGRATSSVPYAVPFQSREHDRWTQGTRFMPLPEAPLEKERRYANRDVPMEGSPFVPDDAFVGYNPPVFNLMAVRSKMFPEDEPYSETHMSLFAPTARRDERVPSLQWVKHSRIPESRGDESLYDVMGHIGMTQRDIPADQIIVEHYDKYAQEMTDYLEGLRGAGPLGDYFDQGTGAQDFGEEPEETETAKQIKGAFSGIGEAILATTTRAATPAPKAERPTIKMDKPEMEIDSGQPETVDERHPVTGIKTGRKVVKDAPYFEKPPPPKRERPTIKMKPNRWNREGPPDV